MVLIAFLVLSLLLIFVDRFKAEYKVYLFSFGIVIGQAIFPTWFFQGIEKMKIITIVNFIAKTIFTIAIFIFVIKPRHYELVPICNSTGFMLAGFFGLILSQKHVAFKAPEFDQIKKITKESSSLFVSNFAISLYTSSNTFILGMFGGDILAGVYASMEKLILAIKSIYTPLYQAIFPALAKKTSIKIKKVVSRLQLPIVLTGILITLIILFVSTPLLNFIYNDKLISSYSNILRILGFIAIFSSLNMLYVSLLFPALKLYKIRMYIMVSGGIYNLILALILVNFFEIYGIAIATTSTELFILILAYYYSKKELRL